MVPAKRARYEGANMGITSTTNTTSHTNTTHTTSHQLFQQNYQEHMKSLSNNPNSPTNTTPSSPTSLYQGLPATTHETHNTRTTTEFDVTGPLAIGAKLGLLLPNPAPDVTPIADMTQPANSAVAHKLALANANGNSSVSKKPLQHNFINFLLIFL